MRPHSWEVTYYVLRTAQGEYKKMTYNPHLAAHYAMTRGWTIHPIFPTPLG